MWAALALVCSSLAADAAPAVPADMQARCLAVLQEGLATGKEWVKVHAAESLLWTGHADGVRDAFLKEAVNPAPFYRIGVWRVLAQTAPAPQERSEYTDKIVTVLLDKQAPDRIHAAETLGKLGFKGRDPEIVHLAQTGTGAMLPMARWILANSGDAKDEAFLADLLASNDADTRGCAAYALRFFKSIRPDSFSKLAAAAQKEPRDSPQRTNILSPWYLHAPPAERPAIHAALVTCANHGTKDDKREMCAALGRVPDIKDIPILTPLLDDPELDARTGAAEAILRIAQNTQAPRP